MLPLAAALSILALAGLAAGAHGNWPDWTLFVCAAAAGVMPSMPAMVRARWSALYRDQPLLRTAFALESVLDEVTLIVGPPLAVGLSVAWFPRRGRWPQRRCWPSASPRSACRPGPRRR